MQDQQQQQQQQQQQHHQKRENLVRGSCLVLGFFIGVMTHLTALVGITFMFLVGHPSDQQEKPQRPIAFLVPNCIAILVIYWAFYSFRTLLIASWEYVLSDDSSSSSSMQMTMDNDNDDGHKKKELLRFAEYRFLMGTLSGASISYSISNMFMGLSPLNPIMSGVFPAAVIVLWYKAPKQLRPSDNEEYVRLAEMSV